MTKRNPILWQASNDRLHKSSLWQFKIFSEQQSGLDFSDYHALHRWSVTAIPEFWQAVADFSQLRWIRPAERTWQAPPAGKMLGGTWFPESQLSFTSNLLPPLDKKKIRIISIIEGLPEPVVLTSQDLLQRVAECTAALKALGVGPRDRVAGICPNTSEAIIAMLATSALGAIWSSCSPDFGIEGILDRFGQLQPKVLFATRGYQYNAKFIDCLTTLVGVPQGLSDLKACVVIDPLGIGLLPPGSIAWQDFLGSQNTLVALQEFKPVATDFDHPLYILYSSGTTGKPKCIIHSVGGTLLQHKKELLLHCDLGPEDRLLYFTTCGWMMWNWMVSALSTGAGLVLFEGSINRDNFRVLWQAIADHKVSCFGTSPKFLSTVMKAEIDPADEFDLKHLRTLLATGSPLLPEHYEWVYSKVKSDLHLASISGGTDIVSCFMLGNPWLPVYAGEIQAPGLGMALECWDEAGRPLLGQRGELVCIKPFPAMPLGFLQDDGQKYHEAYFNFYPHTEVWRHGDYIEITEHGGIVVYGRSDATLNPGGIRIGTAEIYRQIEQMPELQDSIAVSWQQRGESEMLLLVKLQMGLVLTDEIIQRIKQQLKRNLSPRHVPALVMQVSDIPYTLSGKKLEMAVTKILSGEGLDNASAIANPACLKEYELIYQKLSHH